jgi:hypothetical protein
MGWDQVGKGQGQPDQVGKGQGQPGNYCSVYFIVCLHALIVDEWHDFLCTKSLVLFLRQEH